MRPRALNVNKIGKNIPGEAKRREPLRRRTHPIPFPPQGSQTNPGTLEDTDRYPLPGGRSEHLTMKSLAAEIGEMDRGQFLADYPYHFLIQESHLESSSGQPGFFTLKSPLESAQPCDLLSTSIYILKKKRGELFQDMITVGRAANNDVVLDYSCVSKFHACFTKVDSNWSVTDSGSTNGTYLEKEELEARSPKPLSPDMELSFSKKLSFRFVDASRLFNYLDYFRRQL